MLDSLVQRWRGEFAGFVDARALRLREIVPAQHGDTLGAR